MSCLSHAANKRALANAIDDILRRAYGEEYDGEEWHTRIAASLAISSSTLYSYLNATAVMPAQIIGPLATLVTRERGVSFGSAILHAVLGSDWSVSPISISPEDEQRLSDTNAILDRVGKALASIGATLADGRVSMAEYRGTHGAIEDAKLSLMVTDRRLLRSASEVQA